MPGTLDQTRNIGIMAHVDAGKTTLTERILYDTGAQRYMGAVDDGTATTDYLLEEQERGITVNLAATSFSWRGRQINLIDTPGHVDFAVEVERSMRVLDGVVVIFSATKGVEPQTEAVWRQAEQHRVPRIAFVNKMDRVGADLGAVVEAIRRRLHPRPVAYQIPLQERDGFSGVVDVVTQTAWVWDSGDGAMPTQAPVPKELQHRLGAARAKLIDVLADADDDIVSSFVELGDVSSAQLLLSSRNAVLDGRIVPVFCGSAINNRGVQPLLDAVVHYLPSPADMAPERGVGSDGLRVDVPADRSGSLCALVFKLTSVPHGGEFAFLRVYSGVIAEGSRVMNSRTGASHRVRRLSRVYADSVEGIAAAGAGDIVAVAGFKGLTTGDTLCDPERPIVLEPMDFANPVMSVVVEAATAADEPRLAHLLGQLANEDPTLQVGREFETGRLLLSGMGELHLDIARERLQRYSGVTCRFGRPRVAWRETVSVSASAHGSFERVVGGRGLRGAVSLTVEPLTRGTGIQVVIDVPEPMPRLLLTAVEHAVRDGLGRGPLGGYQMTDLRVTVDAAEYHPVDSNEVAFRRAAATALRDVLANAGVILLEPIMHLEVATPGGYIGAVIHDLNARRADISDVRGEFGKQIVVSEVPLGSMFGYAAGLRSTTKGRASFSMHFDHYASVPATISAEIVANNRGA